MSNSESRGMQKWRCKSRRCRRLCRGSGRLCNGQSKSGGGGSRWSGDGPRNARRGGKNGSEVSGRLLCLGKSRGLPGGGHGDVIWVVIKGAVDA